MKSELHPTYGPVAFRDVNTGQMFITRSTLVARPGLRQVEVDGRLLPCVDVDISSDSHPLWTGRARVLDAEGRVQAFNRRYGQR